MNKGEITGTINVGGIVGCNDRTIKGRFNNFGNVTGNENVGGIVGKTKNKIKADKIRKDCFGNECVDEYSCGKLYSSGKIRRGNDEGSNQKYWIGLNG